MTASAPLLAKRLIEPDAWTCPHGARSRPLEVETFGPEVADVVPDSLKPDPQQQLILDLVFAVRPDGLPASFEICIICCRQNMKTGSLKQIALGWLYVMDEPDVVWSAHEMSTTLDAQSEIADLMRESPALRRRMPNQRNEGVYADNGSERIELTTGQTLMFKARTATGARGLARRKLILDEAFALTSRQLGSILPVMLAKRGPQVVYASSPGLDTSDALADIRRRGLSGSTPMMTYVEWGAPFTPCEDPDCLHPKDGDPACALNRPELWLKANPAAVMGRMPVENIANMRQALSAEEFMRECLGWWEDQNAGGLPVFSTKHWGDLASPDLPPPRRGCVVVDVEPVDPERPGRTAATVGIAGPLPDGRVLVLEEHSPGVSWVPEAVRTLRERMDVVEVALHPSGQAGAVLPGLTALGIDVHELTHKDMGHGCASFQHAVADGTLAHLGQAEFGAAIAAARVRTVSEAQLWVRKGPVPMGPLVACSVATHRWAVHAAKPKTPPPSPVGISTSTTARGDAAGPDWNSIPL